MQNFPGTLGRSGGRIEVFSSYPYYKTFTISRRHIIPVLVGVSPAGVWLFRDVHKQNDAVVKISCQALLYLSAMPLIEAVVSSSFVYGGI